MRKSLDEGTHVVCWVVALASFAGQLWIELIGTVFTLELLQVTELSLASSFHPLAGQYFSGHDLLCVHLGNVRITVLSH